MNYHLLNKLGNIFIQVEIYLTHAEKLARLATLKDSIQSIQYGIEDTISPQKVWKQQ